MKYPKRPEYTVEKRKKKKDRRAGKFPTFNINTFTLGVHSKRNYKKKRKKKKKTFEKKKKQKHDKLQVNKFLCQHLEFFAKNLIKNYINRFWHFNTEFLQ